MLTLEQKLDCFEEQVHRARQRSKRTFRYTDAELYNIANSLLRCADGWDLSVGAKELVDGLRKRLKERKAAHGKESASRRREKKLAKRQKSFAFD